MRAYFDIPSSCENLTTNLMRLPIKKETKDPRQFKFHLRHLVQLQKRNLSRSTRSRASIRILPSLSCTYTHHFPRSHKAHTQAHTIYTILEGTRVTIVRIQERSWKKREVERRKLVVHRTWYGLKKVHMLTHGASIQVRSSSGMRLTRRLSLDWPLKASATTVRRGSHLFSRASLLAIVKDENDVASPGCGSLFLSLCLLLLLVPERCIPTTIDVCTQRDPRWGFSTYGPVKTYTASRNLSLESAMIRRRSGRCLFSLCALDLFLANVVPRNMENWYGRELIFDSFHGWSIFIKHHMIFKKKLTIPSKNQVLWKRILCGGMTIVVV